MRLFRFGNSLLYTGVVLLLSSCGSGGSEKTTSTDSTAAADSAAKAKPVNTIVTTPVNTVTVMHKVANYAKWLTAYEAHDSMRLASGLHSYVIGRGLEDSNMVVLVLKVDDTAKANAFQKSSGLKEAMKKAGVLGAPMSSTNTSVWRDTASVGPLIRSMVLAKVKDWDTFIKAFEDGRQVRRDNGIIDRVVGHDWNDNKSVHVVTALADTAKAFAYYKSDDLKKRREAAGVIGQPTRVLFRIVKMQ